MTEKKCVVIEDLVSHNVKAAPIEAMSTVDNPNLPVQVGSEILELMWTLQVLILI